MLLVPAERYSEDVSHWRDSKLQPLGYKPSALAIELNSSETSAGMELYFFISHL